MKAIIKDKNLPNEYMHVIHMCAILFMKIIFNISSVFCLTNEIVSICTLLRTLN